MRGRRVYLVQSTVFPANDHFMELLFWIDALKRASAASVTALIPYFSYGKGDKKDEPRVSIRARVCADAIESGRGRPRRDDGPACAPDPGLLPRAPVDDLYAVDRLCAALRRSLPRTAGGAVSPDAGFAKKARAYAERLHAPLAMSGDGTRTATKSAPRR